MLIIQSEIDPRIGIAVCLFGYLMVANLLRIMYKHRNK